jgi:hypothetical protein
VFLARMSSSVQPEVSKARAGRAGASIPRPERGVVVEQGAGV